MNDMILAHLRCPTCGVTCCRDVTFSFSMRNRCFSDNTVYRVGDRVKGFPPIPLFEVQGIADFSCCSSLPDGNLIPDSCVVQIAFGRIVKLVYPQPEDWEWQPLPPGRNTRRRKAAGDESYRRDFEDWRAKRTQGDFASIGAKIDEGLGISYVSPDTERVAFALYRPISYGLDYKGVVGELMRDASWPENYRKDGDGRWVRRSSRRLF